MPVINDVAIARYALGAGWTTSDATIAVAIAFRESGGNTDALGDVGIQTATYGPSVGLWQIRSLKSQKGTGGQRDEVANHDPAINAKHAYEISGGGKNWRPWSVFVSGNYMAGTNLTRAASAVTVAVAQGALTGGTGGAGGDTSQAGAAGGAGSSGAATGSLSAITNPDSWKRIGFFLLGALLLLIGLMKITNLSPTDVIPAGKALKVAKKVV